jgi:hypothetical protein
MVIGQMEKRSPIHDRVLAVLEGRKPDRIPFIDRMDFWYRGRSYQDKIPEPFRDMSLSEIHQVIGFGQEDWLSPCAYKYHNLELVSASRGVKSSTVRARNQLLPRSVGKLPVDRPGDTTTGVDHTGRSRSTNTVVWMKASARCHAMQLTVRPVRGPE